MTTNVNSRWNRVVSIVTMFAFVLAVAPNGAFAQARTTSPQKPVTGSVPSADRTGARKAAPEAGGTREGIKVHGAWTIDVRNPDGTLASHTEFRNSLTSSGPFTLINILTRVNSVGLWTVELATAGVTGLCSPGGTIFLGSCFIHEPASTRTTFTFFGVTGPIPGLFKTLTVSSVPGAYILLEGTATASLTDKIVEVKTTLDLCPPGTLPTGSCGGGASTFTSAFIPSGGVSVQAGQIVQVKVMISFS